MNIGNIGIPKNLIRQIIIILKSDKYNPIKKKDNVNLYIKKYCENMSKFILATKTPVVDTLDAIIKFNSLVWFKARNNPITILKTLNQISRCQLSNPIIKKYTGNFKGTNIVNNINQEQVERTGKTHWWNGNNPNLTVRPSIIKCQ